MGFVRFTERPTKAQLEHVEKRETCEKCYLIVHYGAFPNFCDEWYRLGKRKKKAANR